MKPWHYVGSSKKALLEMPNEIQKEFGYALYQAQEGDKPGNAKPIKGFGGAAVLEILESRLLREIKPATSAWQWLSED